MSDVGDIINEMEKTVKQLELVQRGACGRIPVYGLREKEFTRIIKAAEEAKTRLDSIIAYATRHRHRKIRKG